jgi:hypothetical protein
MCVHVSPVGTLSSNMCVPKAIRDIMSIIESSSPSDTRFSGRWVHHRLWKGPLRRRNSPMEFPPSTDAILQPSQESYCDAQSGVPFSFSRSADTLETILKLGAGLSDRPSIGKMWHSYALQLLLLENCMKCWEEERSNELMRLLPGHSRKRFIATRAPPKASVSNLTSRRTFQKGGHCTGNSFFVDGGTQR